MIDSMSIEEKVGQLFMCGFDGTEPNEDIMTLIESHFISGICYFSRNLKEPKQIRELSTQLQRFAKIPLFLTIDQEGGMVVRVEEGVTVSPGNMALGATGKPEYAYQMAKIVGQELKMMGINMNFAPSLDVNNNPNNPVIGVRSFGENPTYVAKFGIEAIRGYQDAGISAVAKHFPGHGDTEVDSHLGLPVVNHSLQRIKSLELFPFKQAIHQNLDAIMVSHVCFPTIEENVPATLSKNMITGLLREDYHYDGVVVTDCFEMKAIEEHYGVEDAAILAIEAGNDLILFSHTYEKQKRAITAVVDAVKTGRLSEERINDSVRRILRLKKKRTLKASTSFNYQELAKREHLALAQKVSDESITLVKDDNALLPLDTEKETISIWPQIGATSLVDEPYKDQLSLGTYLNKDFVDYEELFLDDINRENLLEKADTADQIILCTYNALTNSKQRNVYHYILEKYNQKVIVCALRNPYDLVAFSKAGTYIATYENKSGALASLAKVLSGKIKPKGTLPVSL